MLLDPTHVEHEIMFGVTEKSDSEFASSFCVYTYIACWTCRMLLIVLYTYLWLHNRKLEWNEISVYIYYIKKHLESRMIDGTFLIRVSLIQPLYLSVTSWMHASLPTTANDLKIETCLGEWGISHVKWSIGFEKYSRCTVGRYDRSI